jgi:tetratricopeptide (TPR) repeat protein
MSKKKRRRGDSLVKKAWGHISGGEGYDAREVLFTLFDKYPDRADKETTLIFAWSFEVEGRIYKAEDWTRNLLERHPDYMEAWELLAHLLSEMEERQDDLQEVVDHMLELDPNSISALRALASGYYNSDKYDDAIRIYQDIVDRSPDDPLS